MLKASDEALVNRRDGKKAMSLLVTFPFPAPSQPTQIPGMLEDTRAHYGA